MFEGVKRWMYDRYVRTNLVKSKDAEVPDLNPSRAILLLYKGSPEKDLIVIEKFASQLRREGKKVLLVGFYDSKEDIDDKGKNHFCFSRKQTNWYGRPKDTFLSGLADYEIDVLINLDTTGQTRALHMLAASTSIPFKVSISEHRPDLYHLIVSSAEAGDISRSIAALRKMLTVLARAH